MNDNFYRVKQLPPYVFAQVEEDKAKARAAGRDIIDFGLGNPDGPSPPAVVEKLIELARDPKNHRYQPSKGLPATREAICAWYRRRYGVPLVPDTEAVATIGSKEGLGHLMLGIIGPGDVVITPDVAYPIHISGIKIAGGEPAFYHVGPGLDHFGGIEKALRTAPRKPIGLVVNFPHNPTSAVEGPEFFRKVVTLAKANDLWVISDLAYADLTFDGFRAPSILEVAGAKDLAVEFFTVSKSYNMPGWRLGFCVGNPKLCNALVRMKTYLDYGIFAPVQLAGAAALAGADAAVAEIRETYRKRRDALVKGLNEAGWPVEPPRATMFLWAKIPGRFGPDSMKFTKWLLEGADVAVSPGMAFGPGGEGHVRMSFVEGVDRTLEAARRIGRLFARA